MRRVLEGSEEGGCGREVRRVWEGSEEGVRGK